MLKLANSVFYGILTEIGVLEEAVQIIGLREIQDLVLATSVINAFNILPRSLIDVASFWKHSIACGIASSLVAEQHHDPVPERLFAGGLLHDTGRLILILNAAEESQAILRRCEAEEVLAVRAEREAMGWDHAMLGAEFLASWKLPHSLVEMVGCHHDPSKSLLVSQDAFTVHYADFIVSALEFGNSGEFYVSPLVVPGNCEKCLLEEEQIETLVDKLETKTEAVFNILTETNG